MKLPLPRSSYPTLLASLALLFAAASSVSAAPQDVAPPATAAQSSQSSAIAADPAPLAAQAASDQAPNSAAASSSQQTTPSQPQQSAPAHPPQAPLNAEQKNEQRERETGTSRDRLGFILPNFLTIDDVGKVPRLTWQQKFKTQTRSSFDWTKIPWYAFLAGISQATNSDPALGQGGLGYGKRLAMTAADNTIENYWTSAIMPSLLHQDPRFYVKDNGSILARALYPVGHVFVTRGDSGRREFNFSEIFGGAIAAAISTYTYHPHSERTLGYVGQTWGDETAYDTVSFEAKEFWPYVRRRLRKQKSTAHDLDVPSPLQP